MRAALADWLALSGATESARRAASACGGTACRCARAPTPISNRTELDSWQHRRRSVAGPVLLHAGACGPRAASRAGLPCFGGAATLHSAASSQLARAGSLLVWPHLAAAGLWRSGRARVLPAGRLPADVTTPLLSLTHPRSSSAFSSRRPRASAHHSRGGPSPPGAMHSALSASVAAAGRTQRRAVRRSVASTACATLPTYAGMRRAGAVDLLGARRASSSLRAAVASGLARATPSSSQRRFATTAMFEVRPYALFWATAPAWASLRKPCDSYPKTWTRLRSLTHPAIRSASPRRRSRWSCSRRRRPAGWATTSWALSRRVDARPLPSALFALF